MTAAGPAPTAVALLTDRPSRDGLPRAAARFLTPHAGWLAAAVILPLLASGLAVTTPVLIGGITDALLAGERAAVVRLGVGAVLVAVVSIAVQALSRACLARLGEYVVRDVRDRVVTGLLGAPLRFLERHRAGELLQRSTAEIADLSAFVRDSMPVLVGAGSSLAVTSIVLATRSWQLLLVALAVFLPGATLLTWVFRRRAPAVFAADAAAEADVIDGFAELARVRSVLRHAGPRGRAVFAQRDADRNTASVRAELRAVRVGWWVDALIVVESVCLAVLVLVGARLVDAGIVSVGVVVTFVLAARTLFSSFDDIASLVTAAEEAATGGARALDLLTATGVGAPTRTAATPHPTGPRPDPRPADLELVGVDFAYEPGVPVLRDVTLRIPAGQRCCLVGRTGAGKSTLAKVIAGLYPPDAGSVTVGGDDLTTLAPLQRARRVAYVPQQVHLGGGTIRDELLLADPDATDADLHAAIRRLSLAPWFADLPDGLDSHLGDGHLSVGERQLVGLARVALLDADVLVLDEVTSDLDPDTAALVESALHEIAADRTLIVVAHRPETIAAAGRIIPVGPPST